MKVADSALVRAPVALILGSMVFAVGFVRLIAMSTRFTTLVMHGERPDRTLSHLRNEREMKVRSRDLI